MTALEASATAAIRGPRAAELMGITYRRLDYLCRTDVLRPSIADPRGGGHWRLYDVEDIAVGRIIERAAAALGTCGQNTTSLQPVRVAAPALREIVRDAWSTGLPAGLYITPFGDVHLEPTTGIYVDLAGLLEGLPPP